MKDETIRTVITLHHCGATPDPNTRHKYADLALSELEAIESGVEQVAEGHIEVKLDFIPVDERNPKDEFETYMVIIPHLSQPREAHWKDGVWNNFVGGSFVPMGVQPTHWAEIPAIKV